MNEEMKCCICGGIIYGFPHNASPVKDGVCCNTCNSAKVIPARLKMVNDICITKTPQTL